MRRFGAPAVAVSFLTIGFQTAVNAAAGALRMPWWRYVPGVVVGALFWATIYTTIGFAVLEAWFGEHPWPWVIGAVVAVLVVAAVTVVVRRRRATRLDVRSGARGPAARIGMPRHRPATRHTSECGSD